MKLPVLVSLPRVRVTLPLPFRMVGGDFGTGRVGLVDEGLLVSPRSRNQFVIPYSEITSVKPVQAERRTTTLDNATSVVTGGLLGGAAAGAIAGGLTGPAGAILGAVAGAILAKRRTYQSVAIDTASGDAVIIHGEASRLSAIAAMANKARKRIR